MGLTLTPTPLVTETFPGVITPVPFAKTAVRVELDPEAMVEGLAEKLVITGVAPTVTVTVCVAGDPLVPVTVSV